MVGPAQSLALAGRGGCHSPATWSFARALVRPSTPSSGANGPKLLALSETDHTVWRHRLRGDPAAENQGRRLVLRAEEAGEGFWVSGDGGGVVVGGDDGALDEDGVGDHAGDPVGAVGLVSGQVGQQGGGGFVEAGGVPGVEVQAGEDLGEFLGGGWVVEVAADRVGDAGLVEGGGGGLALGAGGVDPDFRQRWNQFLVGVWSIRISKVRCRARPSRPPGSEVMLPAMPRAATTIKVVRAQRRCLRRKIAGRM